MASKEVATHSGDGGAELPRLRPSDPGVAGRAAGGGGGGDLQQRFEVSSRLPDIATSRDESAFAIAAATPAAGPAVLSLPISVDRLRASVCASGLGSGAAQRDGSGDGAGPGGDQVLAQLAATVQELQRKVLELSRTHAPCAPPAPPCLPGCAQGRAGLPLGVQAVRLSELSDAVLSGGSSVYSSSFVDSSTGMPRNYVAEGAYSFESAASGRGCGGGRDGSGGGSGGSSGGGSGGSSGGGSSVAMAAACPPAGTGVEVADAVGSAGRPSAMEERLAAVEAQLQLLAAGTGHAAPPPLFDRLMPPLRVTSSCARVPAPVAGTDDAQPQVPTPAPPAAGAPAWGAADAMGLALGCTLAVGAMLRSVQRRPGGRPRPPPPSAQRDEEARAAVAAVRESVDGLSQRLQDLTLELASAAAQSSSATCEIQALLDRVQLAQATAATAATTARQALDAAEAAAATAATVSQEALAAAAAAAAGPQEAAGGSASGAAAPVSPAALAVPRRSAGVRCVSFQISPVQAMGDEDHGEAGRGRDSDRHTDEDHTGGNDSSARTPERRSLLNGFGGGAVGDGATTPRLPQRSSISPARLYSGVGSVSYSGVGSPLRHSYNGVGGPVPAASALIEPLNARLTAVEELVADLRAKVHKGLAVRVTRDEMRESMAQVENRLEEAMEVISRATSRAASAHHSSTSHRHAHAHVHDLAHSLSLAFLHGRSLPQGGRELRAGFGSSGRSGGVYEDLATTEGGEQEDGEDLEEAVQEESAWRGGGGAPGEKAGRGSTSGGAGAATRARCGIEGELADGSATAHPAAWADKPRPATSRRGGRGEAADVALPTGTPPVMRRLSRALGVLEQRVELLEGAAIGGTGGGSAVIAAVPAGV
ncbi:hypothetical protein GPECTOR_14g178 [Gonium pectorale]|uniref:Uncharacterized protein n=1 Tax=Gonium pectorale TaxID=33097 RepID=A0A150GMD2_GONPE|nr:hypothetical protein GPECTOR_14g178 [Gonium pectorale]|eukprot:KXZ50932.1 hypothetical protein GPECTOR_14g178 [Gonium pectorale]